MRDLQFISHIEEHNGINEAIWLLEQRVAEGAGDKATYLRLLFLYWYMQSEPDYLTNNLHERNWSEYFLAFIAECSSLHDDVDYNWLVGYLLCMGNFAANQQVRGEAMFSKAWKLAPDDFLVHKALALTGFTAANVVPNAGDWDLRLADWGMLGDYVRQVFT